MQMSRPRNLANLLLVMGFFATSSGSANAGLVFVGSWQVDQGPNWTTNPPTYTGQEAAALLFGGVPSDYAISTVDNNPANVNHMAWESIWGIGGGTLFAENAKIDDPPLGYNNPGGSNTAASAYVWDNATGPQYTNYAFKITADSVPEPASLTVFGLMAAGGAFYGWRRRKLVVAA